MTEGSNASRRAKPRPGMIELTFIHADLAAAIARMGIVARLGKTEHGYMLRQPGADRDAVLSRWNQTNLLLQEALAELEQAHARLDAGARHVFQAVGDAEDREEKEATRTP
jgi:hypothetical protein